MTYRGGDMSEPSKAEDEVARLRAEATKWRSADAQWRSQWSQYVHPAREEEDAQEIAPLRAEVERLRATGLRHLDYFKAMRERRTRAEARAERAEATLDRVRALADDTLGHRTVYAGGAWRDVIDVEALRAILDPAPDFDDFLTVCVTHKRFIPYQQGSDE